MDALTRLMAHARGSKLLNPLDVDYAWNRFMRTLKMDRLLVMPEKPLREDDLDSLLTAVLGCAGLPKDDATIKEAIMDCFTPQPSVIQQTFDSHKDGLEATNYFYALSVAANIIKTERLKRNRHFTHQTEYGRFDVTINLAKPEKTPSSIVRDADQATSYDAPPCMLCKAHVGRLGSGEADARANHRIVKMTLNDEPFFMQYSPYQYYQEHAIVIHRGHHPMRLSKKTFRRMSDFVDRFPHYFLGSNADLPIVGGSMLSHEHYQGGGGSFPIDDANVLARVETADVVFEQLAWPMPTIRVKTRDKDAITRIGVGVLNHWQRYHNKTLDIIAKTDQSHNTVTPIMRKRADEYCLTMILRNNHTTAERVEGRFHIHPDRYYVKKENIGLIEAMGRAILPARIAAAMDKALQAETPPLDDDARKFYNALSSADESSPSKQLEAHIGKVFKAALEDCAVFAKDTQGAQAFEAFFQAVVTAYKEGEMS